MSSLAVVGVVAAMFAAPAADVWKTSAPGSVKIAGEIGERFNRSLYGNALKCDLEKDFFPPFVQRTRGDGFIGLGKHADALVHYAANSRDPKAVAEKEKAIAFIITNQTPEGYTGFMKPECRLGKLWDIHEMGFIVQALMADWCHFGNQSALEAARRNVDYVLSRWNDLPANWEQTFITDRETTLGFGYGVAMLFEATGEEKYRDFLRFRRALDDWNAPIVIGRDKMIYGQAYGYTGTCLEQLELYRHDPRPRYLEASLRALDFMTRKDGLLITGNGGIAECWTDDQDGEGSVGETCNAVFELLFWDELLRLNAADPALLGDLMERTVYNALFAAMSRDGRRLRYYTPLNGSRKFWKGDLYCCPNNFRRGMSRLPEYVFYVKECSALANLYTACIAELDLGRTKMKVVEETDYPRSGRVKFTFDPLGDGFMAFKLRIPRWCRRPSVAINGEKVVYRYAPGQILDLPRVWKKGDVVEADFPMEVRTVLGRKRQSGRFAVMRGPVVYALDTRKIGAFKDMHPLDAATVLQLDPKRLKYADGKITTAAATVEWAVGIDDIAVDEGRKSKNVELATLVPYEDEDNTLTYFRTPDIKRDVVDNDELLFH